MRQFQTGDSKKIETPLGDTKNEGMKANLREQRKDLSQEEANFLLKK